MTLPVDATPSPAAAPAEARPSARDIAARLRAEGMRCNCDLDNWEPERSTGHSCVCRIHRTAIEAFERPHSTIGATYAR